VSTATRYRVEAVRWEGGQAGASELQATLNRFADEGWELVFMIPTLADTSIRALVGAASAGTSEMALVLRRTHR
jgi:hypothetical protein